MKLGKVLPVVLLAAGAAVGYAVYKVAKEKIELEKAHQEDLLDEVIYQKIYRKSDETQGDDAELEKQLAPFQEGEGNTEEELLNVEKNLNQDLFQILDTSNLEEIDAEKFPHLSRTNIDAIETFSDESIDKLFQEGDDALLERPIQHLVTFKNEEDMNEFKSIVQNDEFVITNGETALELVVSHIATMQKDLLLDKILYIADVANSVEGVYHGWGAKVTK